MSSLKDEVLKAFAALPNNANVDEMMYQLYVIDRVRRGEMDIKEGNTISQDSLEKESEQW